MKLELDIKFAQPEKFSPAELTELVENVTHALQRAVANVGLSPESSDNYVSEFSVRPMSGEKPTVYSYIPERH